MVFLKERRNVFHNPNNRIKEELLRRKASTR